MTSVGVRERQSSHTNAVDIGFTYYRKFRFYEGSPQTALDLSQYTAGINLVVYHPVSKAQINTFACTVTSRQEPDASGTLVNNEIEVTLRPTGAADNYEYHIVGDNGADKHQIARPAPIGYYEEPPAS